ncbi:MAG: serine/threonine-protein kinase [Gemmataceae bacterium]|nr:serine/threonine-protein kinase [Gemmataceae bacterium]
MPADPARVESLFARALGVPPEDRAGFVAVACGADPDLRERVERLLAAHADLDAAPEAGPGTAGVPPALPVTADLPADPVTQTHQGADAPRSPGTVTADHPGRGEHVGAVLAGKYKLVEEIGEGGMGQVFLAQQTEPVKRAVAVKVIKAGMDSKAVLARFEAERQALAMMDHPNIAKVLDAGTVEPLPLTPSPTKGGGTGPGGPLPPPLPAGEGAGGRGLSSAGRPFFVMELVKGVPITQFCDDRKLTPRQRLELFVPVCQAVQHAHQKGVIHRDIKPSNVLVALYDDKPVPKVIDFGVAKAAGSALTDKTLMTGFGAVVGTPEYMSPEQASLNNLDIDTRSDVYALGVLLYELLTGVTPVDRKSLGKAALLEVLRVVREVEAPRPSAKLSTLDTLPSVAANRGTEPAKLSRLMKGELDWVVLKALEKDRARRYDTANGLARDIQRYLADEVVEARPPSTGYRVRKFVRRHKGQVVAAGLVLVALLAGIAGTTAGLVEARRQRDAADVARQAEAERAEAERAAKLDAEEQKANAVRAAEREAAERKTAEAARAAEAAQKKLAQAKEAEANAVVQFFEDKLFAAARPKGQEGGLGKDVTLRDAITAALPAVAARFKDRPVVEARLRRTLGTTFLFLGDPNAAVGQLDRARALAADRLGPDHPFTLSCTAELSNGLAELELGHAALRLRQEVLAGRRRVLPPDHPDTLLAMNSLANSYIDVGRPREAEGLLTEVLATQRRVLPPDHPDTLASMSNLSSVYDHLGRPRDALELIREAAAGYKRTHPADHPDTLAALYNLACSYVAVGRHAEAVEAGEEAAAGQKAVLGPSHVNTLRTLNNLCGSYIALGRHADVLRVTGDLLAHAKGSGAHPGWVARVCELRLRYPQKLGDPAECRATAEKWEALGYADAVSLYYAACWRAVAAGVYAKKEQPAEAAADADRAMEWLRKAVAAGFRDRNHMDGDADLDALRGRPDFRALVGSLPVTAPPPRPAK